MCANLSGDDVGLLRFTHAQDAFKLLSVTMRAVSILSIFKFIGGGTSKCHGGSRHAALAAAPIILTSNCPGFI
jgi:hypothetical protein